MASTATVTSQYRTLGGWIGSLYNEDRLDKDSDDRRWTNWRRFLGLKCSSDKRLHSLSSWEAQIADLLYDWYHGLYLGEKDQIFSSNLLRRKNDMCRGRHAQPNLLSMAGSSYQRAMVDLFMNEFSTRRQNTSSKALRVGQYLTLSYRNTATKLASIQQAAFNMVKCRDLDRVAALDQPLLLAPSIESCSWLSRDSGKESQPKYLWHVRDQKMIPLSGQDCPPFTCISHTWGRLRDKAKPLINIKNLPWKVPQLKIGSYVVTELPEILSRVPWRTDYIWIDLFCIPQEDKYKWQEERDEEVMRQTSIFGRCSYCVAWLNDIHVPWSQLQRDLCWLSARYLQMSTSDATLQADANDCQSRLSQIQHTTMEFIINPRALSLEETYALWFSSTWTVQETFLCPNMIVVNRDFQPLHDLNGHLLPLNTMIALISTVSNDFDNSDNVPCNLEDLHRWLHMTSLETLLYPTREGIMAMGCNRRSRDTRAQALMCVVDTRDWYKPAQPEPTALIRGAYPHAFVQELAQKVGAPFYYFVSSEVEDLDSFLKDPIYGTMMPFTVPLSGYLTQHCLRTKELLVSSHPAVSSWTIEQDGKVSIKRVGILASMDSKKRVYVANKVENGSFTFVGLGHDPVDDINILDLFEHLAKINYEGSYYYFVSLFLNEFTTHYGLLLQGRNDASKAKSGPTQLVRTGLVMIVTEQMNLNFPSEKGVDWIVL